MEYDQDPNMTVLDGIGIKNDDYDDSNPGTMLDSQHYGYGDSFTYSHDQLQLLPSSSSHLNFGQQLLQFSTPVTSQNRASMHRSMSSLESMKLEKKRERNRIAATKCRQRKMEKIHTLEGQVKQLKKENGSLLALSQRLRVSIQNLEGQINFHLRSGCQVTVQQNQEEQEERQLINGSNQNCSLNPATSIHNSDHVSNANNNSFHYQNTLSSENCPSPVPFGPDSTCLS